ncbi:MAG: STAS domain-containing protein [Acidimicrobiales bacterium]
MPEDAETSMTQDADGSLSAAVERIDRSSWRVTVAGELDVRTAGELAEVLEPLVTKERCSVVVNLSGVDFMDSSGLRALVRAANEASSAGGSLVLARVSDSVKRLLEVTGLVDHLGPPATDIPGDRAVSGRRGSAAAPP